MYVNQALAVVIREIRLVKRLIACKKRINAWATLYLILVIGSSVTAAIKCFGSNNLVFVPALALGRFAILAMPRLNALYAMFAVSVAI